MDVRAFVTKLAFRATHLEYSSSKKTSFSILFIIYSYSNYIASDEQLFLNKIDEKFQIALWFDRPKTFIEITKNLVINRHHTDHELYLVTVVT